MTDDKHIELIKEPLLSAFPNGNLYAGNRGLTIKDYFAAKVLSAVMASPEQMAIITKAANERGMDRSDGIAQVCYEMADAMMEARKK